VTRSLTVCLVVAAAGGLLVAGSASAITSVRCGSTIKSPGTYQLTANCSGAGITIKASHVVLNLKGHTMTGDEGHVGVDAVGGSDVRIMGPGTIKNYNHGVLLEGVSSAYVGDLTTKKNFSWGILILDGSSAVTVERVTAASNGKSGVQAVDSTGVLVTRSTLTGNPSAGVTFYLNADDSRVEDSTFTGNFAGVWSYGDGNEVAGNQITGSVYGIVLDDTATNTSVTGNTVTGSSAYDMFDDNGPTCGSNTWSGNTFDTRNQPCIN
jgi:parallel beta-helix repeat protein